MGELALPILALIVALLTLLLQLPVKNKHTKRWYR